LIPCKLSFQSSNNLDLEETSLFDVESRQDSTSFAEHDNVFSSQESQELMNSINEKFESMKLQDENRIPTPRSTPTPTPTPIPIPTLLFQTTSHKKCCTHVVEKQCDFKLQSKLQ